MKYGIIVDSGCDLTNPNLFLNSGISFIRVPLTLQLGDDAYIDDFSLDIPQFVKSMYEHKGKSGSAAPSPGAYLNAYHSADSIFVITITGTLSGSYSSAMAAKDMMLEEFPDKNIHVINSLSAGPHLSLLALKLKEYIDSGLSFEEIKQKIDTYQKKTKLLFVLESIENLVKNGRVSRIEGGIVGMLGIRLLGEASTKGELDVIKKCRGKMSAYQKLIATMKTKNFNGGKVIMSHCQNEDGANFIKNQLLKLYPNSSIEIMKTSGLCSFYAERGGILLAFEQ